jgi:hypothetical protein
MTIIASKIVVGEKNGRINKAEKDDTVIRSAALKSSSYIKDNIGARRLGENNATVEDN